MRHFLERCSCVVFVVHGVLVDGLCPPVPESTTATGFGKRKPYEPSRAFKDPLWAAGREEAAVERESDVHGGDPGRPGPQARQFLLLVSPDRRRPRCSRREAPEGRSDCGARGAPAAERMATCPTGVRPML